AEQQDVGLSQLNAFIAGPVVPRLDALVVVVNGHGQGLLGLVLADHVRVEELLDLPRLGQAVPLELGGVGELFLDDLVTEVDALVAYVHAWAGDELLDLLLALTAERALQQVPTVTDACHPDTPLHGAAVTAGYSGPTASGGHVPRGRHVLHIDGTAFWVRCTPSNPLGGPRGRADSSRLGRQYLDRVLTASFDHGQNLIEDAIVLGLLGGEELVALDVAA